jgi:hypothetical protein
METIKIVTKDQGQPLMRLLDEPWQNLLKLDGGTFKEKDTSFEFITTDGKKVTADKDRVNEQVGQRISYWGNMNDLGGPQILIEKQTAEPGMYVLRGIYPGSFMIAIQVEAAEQATTTQDNNQDQDGMKKKLLDGQQLALLTQAYMRKLFPVPRTGQCMVEDNSNGCFLYFDSNYYNELTSAIHNYYNKGSFAESNAERDWNNLMIAIDNAETVFGVDTETLRPHFLSKDLEE